MLTLYYDVQIGGGTNTIQIYQDGKEAYSGLFDNAEHSPGDGRIVIGRRFTGSDREYISVQVDELLLFNKTLSEEEIRKLNQ